MARIRSIKPELLEDEKTARLNHLEWRLFVSCLLLADDHGNFRAVPDRVKTAVLWAHLGEDVEKALDTLASVSLILLYEVDGQRYAHVNGWKKHQKVDHPGKALCPGPEKARESREGLAPDRDRDREKEGRGEEAPAGSREEWPPKLWPGGYWLQRFKIAWCSHYGSVAYGRGEEDAKAAADMTDLLEDLGEAERLHCQERADDLFRAYLAAKAGKHPFKWFVERFNGLRVDIAKSSAAGGAAQSHAARVAAVAARYE